MANPPLMAYEWIKWFEGLKQRVESLPTTLSAGDISGGAALTRVNDTNVTVTLTGSPTDALLRAVTMTLGWTGTLDVTRGGTGTGTQFTAGSVVFAGPSGVYAQDNANFFWDDANNALRLGTAPSPGSVLLCLGHPDGTAINPLTIFQADDGIHLHNFANTVEYLYIGSFSTGVTGGEITTSSTSRALTLQTNNGPTGIGTKAPTSFLHLHAGSTAAGKSPLKFTSGSLLTSPEAGAIEFLTDDYYATITTAASRKKFILEGLYTAQTALTMNTARLLGRTTAGVAAAEEISVGANLSLSGGVLSATTGGLSTFVIGDLLYADSTSTLARLADVAVGSVLISGGVGVAPSWNADPFATTLTSRRTALGTTSTDGVILENTTAATGAVTVQYSPRIRLRGTAWDTAASQTTDWVIENEPTSAGTPVSRLYFKHSLNGAAYTTPVLFRNDGSVTILGTLQIPSGQFSFNAAGSGFWGATTNGKWNLQNEAGSAGIGFDVTTDATIKIRTRAQTGDASLTALDLTSSSLTSGRVTFATTGGKLTDDADLTFATDTLTVTKLSAPTSVSTGTLAQTGKTTTYNNIATTGWGIPAIQAEARSTGQVAAVASVAAYTVGAADGSFLVSANVNVTTSTAHNFTAECAYTDETNTARVLTLPVVQLAGTIITAITNVTGAGPYEGIATHIRCKASTSITIRTQAAGTYTTVVYNVEGLIQQVA